MGNEGEAAPLVTPPGCHCTDEQWEALKARSKGVVDLVDLINKIKKHEKNASGATKQ